MAVAALQPPAAPEVGIVASIHTTGEYAGADGAGALTTATFSAEDRQLVAALRLTPPDGLKLYSHDPGPTGKPTVLTVTTPAGPATLRYPPGTPVPDPFQPDVLVGTYPPGTHIFAVLPADYAGGPLSIVLDGLLCSATSCIPVNQPATHTPVGPPWPPLPQALVSELATTLQTTPTLRAPSSPPAPLAKTAAPPHSDGPPLGLPPLSPQYFAPGLEVQGLGRAMVLAVLAGLILNVMPCVLPVVMLKLRGFAAAGTMAGASADQSTRNSALRQYAVWFALGILTWFAALALLFAQVTIGWGEIFQEPWLVVALCALLFALGLSLLHVFTLPIIDVAGPATGPAADGDAHSGAQSKRMSSFTSGLLATLLATPCSGPFLGGVLAWALPQPPMVTAAVLLSVGFGMALPYVVLALAPGLLRHFVLPPRIGMAVELIAAFFLFGTVIYLLGVLPHAYVQPALIALLITAVGAWMWGNLTGPQHDWPRRYATRAVAGLLVVTTVWWAGSPRLLTAHWRDYQPEHFASQLGDTRFLVDFTAEWCVSCKALDHTVLTPENLTRWQGEYDLTFVRVDLTEHNTASEAFLRALGSHSIPTVALFATGGEARTPLVLRDLFTTGQLEDAMRATFDE